MAGIADILDFWATWCENCIEDIPRLDALQNEFVDRIQILLVNIDSDGDAESSINSSFKRKKLISKDTTLMITVNRISPVHFFHGRVFHIMFE